MTTGPTLAALAEDLAAGRTTSRALVEECLARIADESGEGRRAFLHVAAESARKAADAMDGLRAAGAAPSPYAGIPISIKDLFDIAGEVTKAGSRALADAPPATADAEAVARLRRAGFVVIGRTNMTEFAFSGLGVNPHYGTPLSPWDRANARIPGGSSSGAAVSVADGMAHAALGSDTGGSCRLPAAFCGVVGYKPTARRVPLAGGVPLAGSLDSFGPIARSVACCAALDAILANEPEPAGAPLPLAGLRLAMPTTVVLDGLDDIVAATFERALSRLSAAGARIERVAFPEFAELPSINSKGGLVVAESWSWHRAMIERKGDLYDPRVLARMLRGRQQDAADYIDLLAARRSVIERVEARLAPYDALVMPTVAVVPPRLADLDDEEAYVRTNLLVLRNTTIFNFIDGCSISLPIHARGEAPVGLMLAAGNGADRRLFAVAGAVEGALA